MYKFQSYISVPIILSDGAFFGTLCAIDPNPAQLRTPSITGMFRLFADLIAKHLDAGRRLNAAETALLDERTVAELREQFIAVLGHDLRTPVRAINILMDILLKTPLTEEAITLGRLIRDSSTRMQGLIDNLLDLARGRHGRLTLNRNADEPLEPVLLGVISELKAGQPDRVVDTSFTLTEPINCDRARIAQLFSNLLSNALVYGAHDDVVKVVATHREGTLELSVRNYRNAKQHNREGLGLGLYIAHEIAVAHRGTLTAESTPEETCFTLRIPA
jgi:signal transduction histidine kinase